MRLVFIVAGILLAGCEAAPKAPPVTKLVVQGDNYCRLAEKWRWHTDDTKQTIQQARIVNRKYDRTCARKSKRKTS